MSKLYAVADKQGRPRQFGNCRKSTWTSPRWVNYHIGGRGYSSSFAERYDVHTIDLEKGTVEKMSAVAFLSLTQNPEKMKAEIQAKMGFPADIATLEALVKAKALSTENHYLAVNFLETKGIKC
jgi:hypothetical protein